MFDFVSNNKRFVQIFMALIILPFAFWGVDSYNRSGNAADVVATVSGVKISQRDFGDAMRQQQERLSQQLGANFDVAMLDKPEMKRAVMDNLIAQRLLVGRAKGAGLVVKDEQVARLIGDIEAFQLDGKFDKNRYNEVLSRQKISPLNFERRLRDELLGQQLQDVFSQNGYVSGSVVDNIIRLNEQQRVVRVLNVSFNQFEAIAKVDDAEARKYYEQNPTEFQMSEQAKVEYVELSAEGLLSRVIINNEDMRRYYDEHLNDFGTSEERQAAHILISSSAADSQSEQDAAKLKAEQLLQQAKRNPAKFGELAIQNSQDPGSAINGGDLGYFGRGMMVPSFEDATFALNVGDISGLVKTDFGYHIIKLIGIKPSRALSFDEVREGIANRLRQQKATDMFVELAEKFSNIVYEQSDTLIPAADLVGTKVEQSGWLANDSESGRWPPMMLQAIFSEETLKHKRNTQAVEVAANKLMAARVLGYKPASVQAFSDVRVAIRKKLLRRKAVELAVKQGHSTLVQLQGGKKLELNWGKPQSITRGQYGTLDIGLVRQVFQADVTTLPLYIGAESTQGGYIIARIDAIKEGGGADDTKRSQYSQQLRQLTGDEMFRAFLSDAKQRASIELNSQWDVK